MGKPTRLTNAGMALAVLFFLTLGGAPLAQGSAVDGIQRVCLTACKVEAKMKAEAGTGNDSRNRAEACSDAKSDAKNKVNANGSSTKWRVVEYGKCDCDQDEGDGDWVCTVDAKAEKED